MKLPILFQRFEGAVIALAALVAYGLVGGNWLPFLPIWLAIDVSMVGYLVNPRIGAYLYNVGHTLATPIIVSFAGAVLDARWLLLLSLIWFTHIGIDRALGFGLKLPTSFKHTHLGEL